MMIDFLRHPLVVAVVPAALQVIGVAVIARILSERWQRMWQRRDFQRDIFSRFSLLSANAMTQLAELLVARDKMAKDERQRLGVQHVRERSALLAMDGELFGFFLGDNGVLYSDLVHLKNLALTLNQMAFSNAPTPPEHWKPLQHAFSAQRKVIQSRILRHMGFIEQADLNTILAEWISKARASPEGVMLVGAES